MVTFYTHPEYDKLKLYWETYRDLWDGEHLTLTNLHYLWAHEFEQKTVKGGDIFRRIRQQRTQYANFIKPICKRFVALVFQNEVNTEAVESMFGEDEIKDVDGEGNSLVEFIKLAAEHYFLDGKVFALVDSFGQQAQSALEEKALGIRPYLEIIPALNVPDWDIEASDSKRKGKFNELRQEYELLAPRDIKTKPTAHVWSKALLSNGSQYVIELYQGEEVKPGQARNLDRESWTLMGSQAVDGMTEIPIAMLNGDSWVKEACPLALLRHNTQSMLDSTLLFQGTQRVFAAGNFPMDSELVINHGVLTILPEGTTLTIVEPVQPTALQNRLESLTGDMWRVAFMQSRLMPTDSKAVEGADTQREGKEDLLEALRGAGQKIEDFANQFIKNYAAFKGQPDFDGEVKFDLDLNIEDITLQLTLMRQHWDEITKYPTWRTECNKKIALQQNLSEVEEVLQEIEDTDPAENQPDPLQLAQARAGMLKGAIAEEEDEPEDKPKNKAADEGRRKQENAEADKAA